MTTDPLICAKSQIPFADVSEVGFFQGGEEEILFTTHTIFRIDRIQQIHDDHTDCLWQVHLSLMDNEDHDLSKLTKYIRKEHNWTTGWSRLGDILITLGEFAKAEELYTILLDKPSSDNDRTDYYNQLGRAYFYMNE
ncbi:unnamed protein product [Rotaria sp. Silwood1]|nr:unnamed protein product [Rotaria sp. Silwood1]